MYNTETYKHYFKNWKLFIYEWFPESNGIYWKY